MRKRHTVLFGSTTAMVMATLLVAIPSIHADTLTWDAGSDTNWDNITANWSGDIWDSTAPDDAIFGNTSAGTVNLTEDITAGNVTFSNTSGNDYTFSTGNGSDLTFVNLIVSGGGAVTFNNGILDGTGIITSSNNLTLNGGSTTYSGTINHSSGSLTVNNTDSLGTGTVNVSGGRLQSSNDTNLNSSLTINMTGGTIGGQGNNDELGIQGTLNVNSGGSGVTFGGSSDNRTLRFLSGSTLGGNASTVTIGRATTFIDSGVNLTYAGDFLIQRTGPGFTVLNLGDGIDLTTNTNNISFGTSGSDRTRAVAVTDGGTVTLNAIAQNETTDGLAQLQASNGSTLRVAGVISGQDITIAGDGTGTVEFNNNNTYSGITSVNAGTLQIGNGGTSGTLGSSNTSINSGATLAFNRSDNSYSYGGVISGDGAVSQIGSGTTTLTGVNTYTGNTNVSAGVLNLAGTLTSEVFVAAGANLAGEGSTTGNITWQGTTHSLDIDGFSAAALGSTGSGGLDVSAVSAGGFTINLTTFGGGTVDVLQYGTGGFTGNLSAFSAGTGFGSRAGAGTFSDSGTAIQVTTGRLNTTWVGGVDGNWDTSTANWNNGVDNLFADGDVAVFDDTATTFAVTVDGTQTPGSLVFENDTNAYTFSGGNIATDSSIDVFGDANVTFTNTTDITGTTSINKSGSGTLTLQAAKTYSGGTNISGGPVNINNTNSLGTGEVNISGGRLQSTNDTNLNSSLTINMTGGSIGGEGAGDELGIQGTLNVNSGGSGVTFNNSIDNRTLRFLSGSTLGGDASSVTIGRSTTFIESGVNLTYTGNFNIQRTGNGASILNLGDGINLTTNTNNVNFNNGGTNNQTRAVAVTDGGTVTLHTITQNETTDGLAQLQASNGSTLKVAGAITGQDITIAGDGTGTVEFNGNNTYSGTTSVAAGTLQIGNAGTSGTLGTGNTTTSAGATLAFNRSDDTYSYGGVISGDGAVSQIGSGTTTLTGNNTYTGGTSITAGTLLVNNTTGSGTGTGTVTVGNGTDPATLGGTGSIAGATTINANAVHTAGTTTGAGTLTHGDLTYSAGSTITWNLISGSVASGTPGTDWDLISTTGSLDFSTGAAKTFEIVDTSSFDFNSLAANATHDFLVWSNGLAPTGFSNSDFTITYNGGMAGPSGGSFMLVQDTNNIVLRFTAVPEPGTYALMGLALAGFGWTVRRRRQQTASAVDENNS